jgi:hypothetical protein
VLPCVAVLGCGAFATGAYNRAISGSVFKTPYALHEQQYEESPPFIFMPLRPKHTYSSPLLQFYYEINEMKPYVTQRVPKWFVTGTAQKFATWWEFYCGFILSIPLVLPGLLRKGKIRWLQTALLAALITLSLFSTPTAVLVRGMTNLLVIAQVVMLWIVFDDKWSRLAIVTCALMEFELLFCEMGVSALLRSGCLPNPLPGSGRIEGSLELQFASSTTGAPGEPNRTAKISSSESVSKTTCIQSALGSVRRSGRLSILADLAN